LVCERYASAGLFGAAVSAAFARGGIIRYAASNRSCATIAPPSINDWGDDHVLRALDWAGHDESGNLIVGRRALDVHLRRAPPQAVPMARKLERYAQLAQASLNADGSMSSAAGEQPKFTQYVQTLTGDAHVIVKFSPADSGEAAKRWRDLLRCEAHALSVMADNTHQTGVSAAQATVLHDANRVYLEVQRFDRVGASGRLGVISLGAAAFRLAPIYDMLPMRLRPVGQELREMELGAVLPQADLLGVWPQAQALASEFARRVQGDTLISPEFKLLLNK
jgi:hypothetical protein